MPGVLEERSRGELAVTVREVAAEGRANIRAMTRRRSGQLLRFYRSSVSRGAIAVGRVGYLTARAKRSAFYARFINDGTREIAARPFHSLAVEAAERPFIVGQRRALRAALGSR